MTHPEHDFHQGEIVYRPDLGIENSPIWRVEPPMEIGETSPLISYGIHTRLVCILPIRGFRIVPKKAYRPGSLWTLRPSDVWWEMEHKLQLMPEMVLLARVAASEVVPAL